MTVSRSWLLTLAIVALVILWMASGALFAPESQPDEVAEAPDAPPGVRVQVSEAQAMSNRLILQGQTRADRRVIVKAETGGVVERLPVQKGAEVDSGETLVKLAVEERRARLLEAQSLRLERIAEYRAVEALRQSGYQAETELARARAALDAAEAALQVAELELRRTTVTAPFAGTVNRRFVEQGDFVARGDPLAELLDLDPIRVVAQVSERYLGRIELDRAGEVRLPGDRIVPARVTYIGAAASDSTRTFPVEMQVPNTDGRVIEGVTAEMRLPIEQIRAHHVPPSVLSLLDNGQLSVKAIDADNRITAHAVDVLGDSGSGIWLGGLPETLILVVVGHEFVQPGQIVAPVFLDAAAAGEAR